MKVTKSSTDFHTEYATRVFKAAKDAMKVQGEQTLKLIESAQTDQQAARARPGRGKLINIVA